MEVNKPSNRLNDEDLKPKVTLNSGQPTILAGDLNTKNKEWGCRANNPNGGILFNLLQNETWILLAPNEPTYYPMQHNQAPDILDFALLKNMGSVMTYEFMSYDTEQKVLNKLFLDHTPVLMEIKTRPQIVNSENQTKIRWEKVTENLNNVNLHYPDVLNHAVIDDHIDNLTESVRNALKASSRKIFRNCTIYSILEKARELVKIRNRIRKDFNLTGDPQLKYQMNRLRKMVTKFDKIGQARKMGK